MHNRCLVASLAQPAGAPPIRRHATFVPDRVARTVFHTSRHSSTPIVNVGQRFLVAPRRDGRALGVPRVARNIASSRLVTPSSVVDRMWP